MEKLEIEKGRLLQKLKIREALILKAVELLEHGNLNSVAKAAEEMGLSKARGYSYFATIEPLKSLALLHLNTAKMAGKLNDFRGLDFEKELERLIHYLLTCSSKTSKISESF